MTSTVPITNGLVGWYKGEEWNGTSWPDLSGNGNNCTTIRGTISIAGRYIYGGTGDGLRFPSAILPSTYTLFHVAKYNGPSRQRIFDGVTSNWLSGFHSGDTRVAYHEGWLTVSSRTDSTDPYSEVVISCDQKSLYRANGTDYTTNSTPNASRQLSINYGAYYTSQSSDWACAEVIVYNRELTLSEIETIESYLTTRHNEIDLKSIQSIVDGSNPISINEYYGISSYIPSSGTISLNNFRRFAQVPIVGIPPKNLQVYLNAGDSRSYPGTGTTWYDISGNDRHGTWNSVSHATNYFNTSGRYCNGPASNSFGIDNTSGYTVFIVWYQFSLTNGGAFRFYSSNGTGSQGRGIFSHCTWSNSNIYFDQGGCCNADTRLNVACPNATSTWHTTAVVRLTNSSTRYIYIDGSLAATNTAAAANINLNSTAVNYVGDTENYSGVWDAAISSFLAYNRGLTAGEISALHNSLAI